MTILSRGGSKEEIHRRGAEAQRREEKREEGKC